MQAARARSAEQQLRPAPQPVARHTARAHRRPDGASSTSSTATMRSFDELSLPSLPAGVPGFVSTCFGADAASPTLHAASVSGSRLLRRTTCAGKWLSVDLAGANTLAKPPQAQRQLRSYAGHAPCYRRAVATHAALPLAHPKKRLSSRRSLACGRRPALARPRTPTRRPRRRRAQALPASRLARLPTPFYDRTSLSETAQTAEPRHRARAAQRAAWPPAAALEFANAAQRPAFRAKRSQEGSPVSRARSPPARGAMATSVMTHAAREAVRGASTAEGARTRACEHACR